MPLQLKVEFETALHHGSGFGIAGVIDRAVLRDETGMPYLAGSALKGKFRFAAAQLLHARGLEPCGLAGPWCRTSPVCLVCQIFGSPLQSGGAVFEDAYPAAPADSILRTLINNQNSPVLSGGSDVRSSTAIDRHSRRVRPQHLFSTETLPPLVRFQSHIWGELTAEQADCLRQSAKLLTCFGGDSSRGLGFCRYEISEVTE